MDFYITIVLNIFPSTWNIKNKIAFCRRGSEILMENTNAIEWTYPRAYRYHNITCVSMHLVDVKKKKKNSARISHIFVNDMQQILRLYNTHERHRSNRINRDWKNVRICICICICQSTKLRFLMQFYLICICVYANSKQFAIRSIRSFCYFWRQKFFIFVFLWRWKSAIERIWFNDANSCEHF